MTLSSSHETLLDSLFLELIAKVKARLQSQSEQLPRLGLPHDSAAAAVEAGRLIESVYYQKDLYTFPIVLEDIRKHNHGVKENVVELLLQFADKAALSDDEAYALLQEYSAHVPLNSTSGMRDYAAKLQQLRQANNEKTA